MKVEVEEREATYMSSSPLFQVKVEVEQTEKQHISLFQVKVEVEEREATYMSSSPCSK